MTEQEFRDDFLAYSGGFAPNEAFDEMMTYIELECWLDATVTRETVERWFDTWLVELEANE